MADFDRERETIIALVRQGVLTKQQAQAAYQSAKQSGSGLLEAVVAMGYATRDDIANAGASVPRQMASLRELEVDTALVHYLTREMAERLRAVPFRRRGDVVDVAMADPGDLHALDEVGRAVRTRVNPVQVSDSDISWALESYWSEEESKDLEAQYANSVDGLVEGMDAITRLMDAPAVVRLASVLVSQAVEQRASDIHLEPQRQGLVVRYRIDGVLKRIMKLDETMKAPLTSRIKIMAEMDIADSRLPQDGRFATTVANKRIDVRVSSRPTATGLPRSSGRSRCSTDA